MGESCHMCACKLLLLQGGCLGFALGGGACANIICVAAAAAWGRAIAARFVTQHCGHMQGSTHTVINWLSGFIFLTVVSWMCCQWPPGATCSCMCTTCSTIDALPCGSSWLDVNLGSVC